MFAPTIHQAKASKPPAANYRKAEYRPKAVDTHRPADARAGYLHAAHRVRERPRDAGWDFSATSIRAPVAGGLPATLVVGRSDDAHEREADLVANRAVQLPAHAHANAARSWGREAPPEVREVLRAPGQPLDGVTRAFMEPRLRHDFSKVRVHTDAAAAASASSIDAAAYSVGPHVVFGRGQYQPRRLDGARLLAHELAHVVQHSRTGDTVVRRSLLGTLTGAGIGAAVGGVGLGRLGSLLGPAGAALGAVVGGLVGAAVGGYIGDKVSSKSRNLSEPEKNAAKVIFRTSVNLDAVELRRGSLISGGDTPRTSGNIINFPDGYFVADTLNLNPQGALTLIHELVHVWQYQHGGFSYVESSLLPQAVAASRGISRNAAYNWRNAANSGIPWERWNAEQQAECVSDYNEAGLRLSADHYDSDTAHDRLKDMDTVSLAEPNLEKLRAGVGAPGSKPAQ